MKILSDAINEMINEANSLVEEMRNSTVRSLGLLDTPPEEIFNDVVGLAAQVCSTPDAYLTFIENERVFIKSSHNGIGVGNQSTEFSFCNMAIKHPDSIMVVPDATIDPKFDNNPWVTERVTCFYAGIPLIINGYAVGTLCVSDHKPKTIKDEQINSLKALSRVVIQLIKNRMGNSEK